MRQRAWRLGALVAVALAVALAGCKGQDAGAPGAGGAAAGPEAPPEAAPAVAAPTPPPPAADGADVAKGGEAAAPAEAPEAPAPGSLATVQGFEGKKVALLHTANRKGEYEPCGCRVNPTGGLAQLGTWLEQNRGRWDAMLLADAGNLLHETTTLPEEKRQQELDRGEMLVDAHNLLGWDAQGIGGKDLVGGLPRLQALAKRAKYPFLSANLVDAKTGEPLFTPRAVVEKGGVRIGLFSVLSPDFDDHERVLAEAGARVTDPVEAARAQVAALKEEGAQVFVALAVVNGGEAEQLAKALPQLTAVLGAEEGGELRYPRAVGTTYLTDAHEKGKRVSVLTLLVREGEQRFVFADPNLREALAHKVADLDKRIAERQAAIEAAKGDESKARNLGWLQQNLAKLRAERQAAQMELEDAGEGDAAQSFIAYDYPEIRKDLPERADVRALVDALEKKHPALAELTH